MAGLASWLGRFESLANLRVNQESLALWVDASTFAVSAIIITTLTLPGRPRRNGVRIDWSQASRELVEGLRFVGTNPTVRSVMVGLGAGLVGCGAVIPLGPLYAERVLGAGSAGFGLLMTGLGMGAAIGVVGLSMAARRLPTERVFVSAILGSGVSLVLATSVSTLTPAVVLTGLFGLAAGTGYVAGFTIIQAQVSDELRGRTFATLYTLIRFCLLLSLGLSPWLASALGGLSGALFEHHTIDVGIRVAVPGVRLALWLGGFLTIAAGVLVSRDVRRARQTPTR
jgi:dTMP kinase